MGPANEAAEKLRQAEAMSAKRTKAFMGFREICVLGRDGERRFWVLLA